ncbi:hypothetical protein DL93DRAFT_95837 [Clavulina sp. PMI_390]|nr:hypothetical protein DL93DRAFT_95837 [Clavulina sp. PMI_390]
MKRTLATPLLAPPFDALDSPPTQPNPNSNSLVPMPPLLLSSTNSEASLSSPTSQDVPGTIDILVSSSPSTRVGSLTFTLPSSSYSFASTSTNLTSTNTNDNGTDSNSAGLTLDVSNTTVPTTFLLHPEPSAPNGALAGHPDWMAISLRIPVPTIPAPTVPGSSSNASSTSTNTTFTYCAEFQSAAPKTASGSGSGPATPVVVKPCVPAPSWDTSTTSSQLFVYDIVTGQISPFWASLINSTSANTTSLAEPTTASGNTTSSSIVARYAGGSNVDPRQSGNNDESTQSSTPAGLVPALLIFNKLPGSPNISHVSIVPPDISGPGVVDVRVGDNDSESDGDGDDDSDEDDMSTLDLTTTTTNADIDPQPSPSATTNNININYYYDTSPNENTSFNNTHNSNTTFEDFLAADGTDDPSESDPSADPSSPVDSSSTTAFDSDPSASCTTGAATCIGDQFALCANNAWVLQDCGPGTICRVVPVWGSSSGETVPVCDTEEDSAMRIAAGTGGGTSAMRRRWVESRVGGGSGVRFGLGVPQASVPGSGHVSNSRIYKRMHAEAKY